MCIHMYIYVRVYQSSGISAILQRAKRKLKAFRACVTNKKRTKRGHARANARRETKVAECTFIRSERRVMERAADFNSRASNKLFFCNCSERTCTAAGIIKIFLKCQSWISPRVRLD